MRNSTLDPMGVPRSIRKQFINDTLLLEKERVDICIPSHGNQTNMESGINLEDRSDYTGFINPDIWPLFMAQIRKNCQEVDEEEEP